jgi:glycosyltransferase involved in cell wall biosynthesis
VTPRVSVLMSVHDGEQYLREAIDSILGQAFKDFEFIIINDGSTDHTAEIIGSYADPRIRFMSNKTNLGLPASLNLGLDVAAGDYIARMDADDISLPERLSRQVSYMDAHPEIAASGTWAKDIDANGREFSARCLPFDERMKCEFWRPSPIVHPSAIIRKSHLGSLRYDTRLRHAQDYDLWLGLKAHHELGNLPEFLLLYRVHPASITSRHRGSQIRSTHEIVSRRLGLNVSFRGFQHLLGLLPELNPVSRVIARRRLARAIHIPYRNYLAEDLAYARNWLRACFAPRSIREPTREV